DEDVYSLYYTPIFGSDVYDLLITNKKTKQKIYVEAKVRNDNVSTTIYNEGAIYETKKDNSLEEIREEDPENNHIMYVNFTSYGTYIWNISKLRREEKMPKTTTMRANKATMSSTTD